MIKKKNEQSNLINIPEYMKCPMNCDNGMVSGWEDGILYIRCNAGEDPNEDNWESVCIGCQKWKLLSSISTGVSTV